MATATNCCYDFSDEDSDEDYDDISGESTLTEMLELQISEIEMLQSMFPNPGEFDLDDNCALDDIKAFVNDPSIAPRPSRLRFTLTLSISDRGPLELVCQLPQEYPHILPDIFIRSQTMSRSLHRTMSDALHAYLLGSIGEDELCICAIVQWLQDNADTFMQQDATDTHQAPKKLSHKPQSFSRMWIYSHHIYSKIKRKDILDFAHELELTGFSMPGKPGLVCVEGYTLNVDEFWHRLRRMQWKKLVMKEKETSSLEDGTLIDTCRKFATFQEMMFNPRAGKGRGSHSDLGLLLEYLDQNGCAHMFQSCFGIEGHNLDHDET